MKTKEKILHAALELFSVRGYEDTSVAQIAEAVGIKAPSLYNHYRSKQEIFAAILSRIGEQYRQQASMLQLDGALPGADAARYRGISEETLFSMVLQLFRFFLRDPYGAKCRKMLVLEQYRSPEAAELYQTQYYDGPLAYQTELFRQLIRAGEFRDSDPGTMALEFYGPIFTLLQLCDVAPQRIPEAEAMLRKHVLTFCREYHQEAEK